MAGRASNDDDWARALEALRGEAFAEHLRGCRWFGGKAHTLRGVEVVDVLVLGDAGRMILLRVDYVEVAPETYLLPLQVGPDGKMFDALEDENFRAMLMEIIAGGQRVMCGRGELVGICGAGFTETKRTVASRVLKVEQSNSSVLYDELYFLKLYRRPEPGVNPDAELLRYFSEGHKFEQVPGYCGAIEYRAKGEEPRVLALLVKNVVSDGDAWKNTLTALGQEWTDERFERMRLLGRRTAEMHLALAAETTDPNFAPERFDVIHQNAMRRSMGEAIQRMMRMLEGNQNVLPAECYDEVDGLLLREADILRYQEALMARPFCAELIRHHGDYHLGQVLDMRNDFCIIDFEGAPGRPLSERRAKHTPLRDVASMLRSFDYAAHAVGARQGDEWVARASQSFLDGYLSAAEGAPFLPGNEEEMGRLLEVCLLEKAVYEVCYELNNRPDWAVIPLRGILRILGRSNE
ncbi:maltokinase N-terminal cap-like domain-containing protein [Prosthecobacter sp.]|uniref:maltokinase N-terminal cap-like domain-containing protein n=1 Tax=Prosthecobacter sp. TaxID=1965333 RepID=UPI00378448E9